MKYFSLFFETIAINRLWRLKSPTRCIDDEHHLTYNYSTKCVNFIQFIVIICTRHKRSWKSMWTFTFLSFSSIHNDHNNDMIGIYFVCWNRRKEVKEWKYNSHHHHIIIKCFVTRFDEKVLFSVLQGTVFFKYHKLFVI